MDEATDRIATRPKKLKTSIFVPRTKPDRSAGH